MRTRIIAEVGECFNGNMDTAFSMIREAKTAGCDIVKFQLLDMEEVSADDPEYDWFAKIELTPDKIAELIAVSLQNHIEILFTPVSVRTAKMIFDANLKTVKIASSFINKTELLEYINNSFDTVYISTGMAEPDEIAEVVRILNKPEELIILHCISEYPTGPLLSERGLKALDEKDAHLNMMLLLKEQYPDFKIGYSDHTDHIFVPITAAAMGADVIEKHFTLDRKTPIEHFKQSKDYMGTDHVLSVELPLLREMVKQIRRIEQIKGEMKWERSEGERILREFLRGRYMER